MDPKRIDSLSPGELRRLVDGIVDEVIGRRAAVSGPGGRVASLIDHTLLKPEATRADVERLCDEAREFRFRTVCVNPAWVAIAARRLAGSGVEVCSVAGFPLGASAPDVKAFEARRALFDGAREIDMVMNVGALRSGDLAFAQKDIEAVTGPVREAGCRTKVIIEAALLTDEEKAAACRIARAAGADFVKTSTGFGPGGATVADVALMRRVVGDTMGIKAAGGISTYEQLRQFVAAGATRIGASAGVRIVQQARGAIPDQGSPDGY